MTSHSEARAREAFPLAPAAPEEELFDAIIGSLVAGACADALGWPTEFMRAPAAIQRQFGVPRLSDYVPWSKKVGGRFNTYLDFVGAGEYSDDTQLTLSVARSIASDGSVDQQYFTKTELVHWLDYARGAGRTITAAAKAASRARTTWYSNFFSRASLRYTQSGANGAAMRIGPIALANLKRDAPPLAEIFANAITTHGHPRAHVGALAQGAALWEAFQRRKDSGSGPRPFLDGVVQWLREWQPNQTETPEIDAWLRQWEAAEGSYGEAWSRTVDELQDMLSIVGNSSTREVLQELGCFSPSTKGSGTATVAAALHLFARHGRNIEASVTEAVNAVPADTDTIGALVGSLAGVYAGYQHVPSRWTAGLQDLPYFISLGEGLARVARGEAGDDPSLLPFRPRLLPPDEALSDVIDSLRQRKVARDARVRHRALGAGWVQAIHVQEVRRRGGGEVIYARVALDIGQTCQFRAHIPARTSH
jgi:ADP-ribosylglycohydrolase